MLTETDYDHAIALLTQRYDQPHKIIQAHMRALSEISSPTSSLSSLQLFYETIEAHIRGLAVLCKTEESYEEMLVTIILGRLPNDARKNLAHEHDNTEWTISKVMDAILKEITVLESGSFTYKGNMSEDDKSTMTTMLHAGASRCHLPPTNQGTKKK